MSEKKSRKQCSDEYKSEVVRLVNNSGKPVTQIARELGVNANVLHRWAREEREAQTAGKTRGGVKAVYLVDISMWQKMDEIYGGFFGCHRPARTTVPVQALRHPYQIEIDVIAAVRS